MFVAIIQVELRLHGPLTLKERRNIVNSLKERVRRKFGVSIAEVGVPDAHGEAVLGIALVTNEAKEAERRAQKIIDYVENDHEAEVADVQMEIL